MRTVWLILALVFLTGCAAQVANTLSPADTAPIVPLDGSIATSTPQTVVETPPDVSATFPTDGADSTVGSAAPEITVLTTTPLVAIVASDASTPTDDIPSQPLRDRGRLSPGQLLVDAGLQPTIYFGYNEAEMREGSEASLERHIAFLQAYPNLYMILEGHTDERGTSAYNLSLGLRRAETVRNFLVGAGIAGERVRVASFGEERPVLDGHDEDAWQWNRRVEIYYRRLPSQSAPEQSAAQEPNANTAPATGTMLNP